MTYGISQDPLNAPSGLDQYTSRRDVIASSDDETVRGTVKRDWREKTAFEWVSPNVRVRHEGIVGIEFDGRGLVVIGLDGSRKAGHVIDHVLVTRCEDTPDSSYIADRLKSFVHHRRPGVHVVLSTPRAVVRHFLLPPIPARQRHAAALWEGQKLIPFSLKDGEALYGLDFVSAGERGWWATLVAVPAEDAAPILDAIVSSGWMLCAVSFIGTQRFVARNSPTTDEAMATVTWSDRRGCFSVYHRKQLIFHYDLGPMPATPAKMDLGVTPESMSVWQRWTDSLGVAVGDALDFYLNVNPSLAPSELQLYGLPPATAPLLTEWQTRFPGGVALDDPISACCDGLPDGVREWLSTHPGLVAPVMAAMTGAVAVDLTPARIREQRSRRHWERIARGLCLLSILVSAMWSGLIWARVAGHRAEAQRAREALAQSQTSPVNIALEQATVAAARNRLLLATASQSGQLWMPWLRTVLSTLPDNANLAHVDMEYRADRGGVIAHLEGTLGPALIAHAMTYREWFDRLRPLCGSTSPVLANERVIDFNGVKQSAFTIELSVPGSVAPVRGGSK